jgi:uncharacterized protein DUF1566/Big-like domain-containing protein
MQIQNGKNSCKKGTDMSIKPQRIVVCILIGLMIITLFSCKVEDPGEAISDYSDESVPSVSSCAPGENDTQVATDSTVFVAFSEEMDSETVNDTTIKITRAGVQVAGGIALNSDTANFTPHASFKDNSTYKIMVTTDVKDIGGNAMISEFSSYFSTGSAIDTMAPAISSINPTDQSTDVKINIAPVITFNETMDENTLTTSTIILFQGNTAITGTVAANGASVSFTSASNLMSNTEYIYKVTAGVSDISGHFLSQDYSWSFTTGDFSASAKTITTVRNLERGVILSTNQDITSDITYSIVSNPSHGSVSLSGATATFDPASDYIGADSFTYKANRGVEDAQSATVSITVKYPLFSDTGQTGDYTSTHGEDSDYTINAPSYTDNSNGTVTDNVTGLIWQQSDDDSTRTWSAAGTYCDGLTLGGNSDWRLPTVKELVSILDLGIYSPSINAVFTGTNSSSYWSSTTYASDTSYAWLVFFDDGGVSYRVKTSSYYVRCVRGGQ